jgi:hypothetical protein
MQEIRVNQDTHTVKSKDCVDFWLLYFSFLIGAGTAVTAQNNLGQLGEAQSLTNVTVHVSLIGTMGRLGGGVVSDYGVR